MTSTSFADAVKRLAERREARERDHRRASTECPPSQARQRLGRLPSPFNQLPAAWDNISGCEGTRPAFRVGQVDAELLDEELLDLLKGQVGDALKYFSGGHLKDDWSAEIQLILRALLFKLSIWDHDTSYGASLQNLKYTDARHCGPVLSPPTVWQKSLYGLVTVVGKYGWTKWEDWLVNQDDGFDAPSPSIQRLTRLTSGLTTAHSVAALASFLVFLLQGRYRTLVDRILRIRLAPPTSQVSRQVSFEYQNRQLVWHAFTEFLLFVLPLIGINRWRRWLSRMWRKTKSAMRPGLDSSDAVAKGELAFLPERTCAICYQDQNSGATSEAEVLAAATSGGVVGSAQTDVTNPYEAIPCGCIYCFVCLATRLEREEGEGWTCLRCGEDIKECKPWSGDVHEPTRNYSKTVAFSDEVQDVRMVEIRGPEDEEEDEKEEDDLSQWSVSPSGSSLDEFEQAEFEQAEYEVAGDELSDE